MRKRTQSSKKRPAARKAAPMKTVHVKHGANRNGSAGTAWRSTFVRYLVQEGYSAREAEEIADTFAS